MTTKPVAHVTTWIDDQTPLYKELRENCMFLLQFKHYAENGKYATKFKIEQQATIGVKLVGIEFMPPTYEDAKVMWQAVQRPENKQIWERVKFEVPIRLEVLQMTPTLVTTLVALSFPNTRFASYEDAVEALSTFSLSAAQPFRNMAK
jgi:hypothetical protein